jgi:UDP-N-acetylglucosamine 2-epimerase (non-hydrolysing)
MKIAIVLGTRPEIIKMSPIIRECERRQVPFYLLHTGQHYSYEMDRVFFEDLSLPDVKYNLDVGSGTHAVQPAKILVGVEEVLREDRPDVMLVQGDTNTVVAAALAASKVGVRIGHVEAGLRSQDRTMPEEINRVVADHLADHLFAPTEDARRNLAREGIDRGVGVTGNTVVDALQENRRLAESRSRSMENLGLKPKDYILVTTHRQENVDHPARLTAMMEALEAVGGRPGCRSYSPPIPAPRTIEGIGHRPPERVDNAAVRLPRLPAHGGPRPLVLTDSGGVQEEAVRAGRTVRDHAREHRAAGDGSGGGEHAGRDRSGAHTGGGVGHDEPHR